MSPGKRQRRQQRQRSIAGLRLGSVEITHAWLQAVPTQPSERSIEKSGPGQEAQKTPEAAQRSIAGLRLGSVEIAHAWLQAAPAVPTNPEPSESIEKSEPVKEAGKTAEAAQHSGVETWQRRNHSFLDSDSGRANANATVRAIRVHV